MAYGRLLGLLVATAALGGCVSQLDLITDRENMLSAAGFTVLPANTPDRQAMLASLPPDRVSQKIEGDHVSYLYPDPVVCHCLYVGSQQAFGQYQQIMMQRQIARDQVTAARLNADFYWNWGPWGGYRPFFY
jgi:hypothetical protein